MKYKMTYWIIYIHFNSVTAKTFVFRQSRVNSAHDNQKTELQSSDWNSFLLSSEYNGLIVNTIVNLTVWIIEVHTSMTYHLGQKLGDTQSVINLYLRV